MDTFGVKGASEDTFCPIMHYTLYPTDTFHLPRTAGLPLTTGTHIILRPSVGSKKMTLECTGVSERLSR